jgi:hypothetical protein
MDRRRAGVNGGSGGLDLDDFVIDNIVIWFKTHPGARTKVVGAKE